MIIESQLILAGETLLMFLPILGLWALANYLRVRLGGRPGIQGLVEDLLIVNRKPDAKE